MDDTGDKMGPELLLRLMYVGYRGQCETRLSFYKPLCCFLNLSIFRWSPHFVTSFLTLHRCKITVLRLLDRELHCVGIFERSPRSRDGRSCGNRTYDLSRKYGSTKRHVSATAWGSGAHDGNRGALG